MQDRTAALYIRVSTDAQYEEGYSVEAQKEKLKKYCELKDIKRYEFYIDGGWSGSNIDRPEIKRLIDDIKNDKINTVIVYKLDRLSRSQKDTIFLLEDVFIPHDCAFISLNENFDTSTPYGKAMIGILSVFAQLERENIRERTRMGMYERVKLGLWRGGGNPPFGYDYDQNKNILVPNNHADDVKQIFDLYLQGYSTTKLAKMFGFTNDRSITAILDRITYLGKIKYDGEIIDGQHEALIDESTWAKVRDERERRSTKNVASSTYLLTGLVYCGRCGAKLRYQKWGKKTMLYCYSQQKSKPALVKDPNCDNMRYLADDVERLVIEDLFKRTQSIKGKDLNLNNRASALKVLQDQYDKIHNKIIKLYNLYAINDDELLLETIEENKAKLNKIAKEIESETKTNRVAGELYEKRNMIKNLTNSWNIMSAKDRQQAVRICIDKITLTGEDVDIVYNF